MTQSETIYTKHFTPDQANQMLPLVKTIVDDILLEGRRLLEIRQKREEIAPESQSELFLSSRLAELYRELEDLGCEYKDWNFEVGLVDFPALIDGQEVFLCWRSDEESVAHFHPIETGYAGREPL